jgi:UDP-glucose 4-epimerase
MGKKALVFGGSGFLGSYVADELSAQEYDVTIFDRKKSPPSSTPVD